jgi:hypothetical protein
VRFSYAPTVRALIALNAHDAANAIEQLEQAKSFDSAIQGTWSGFFGQMYPAYVRGQAYLAIHDGPGAAEQFEKILAHHGVVGSDFVGAMARLQLARALVAAGNPQKAKAAYEEFLSLWKLADTNIPLLRVAKSEYKELNSPKQSRRVSN